MDDLRWDDLRVLLAVARAGTLAGAGDALGVNPSTVHRRVAALELALGARLFDRDPRGYALTPLGEALLPRAEEVEEAVLATRRAATGHDRTATGPVRLTLPETLVSVIAPALAAVCDAAPGLRPVLLAHDAVLDLGADADIALRPATTPPDEAVAHKVGRVAWAVYGPAHDPGETAWVAYAPHAGPRAAIAWFAAHHPDAAVLMEVTTVGAMHRVLACTRARGLLPCYLGDPDPRLARRTDPLPDAAVDLWLLVHADLRRSARVRALLDLLRPHLEAMRLLLEGASADPPQ